MEALFNYHIRDAALQEQIRTGLMRMYPEITEVDFGDHVRILSEKPVDRCKIEEFIVRFRHIYKSVTKDLIYEQRRPLTCQDDAFPHLERTRQVVRIADGQYLIQGDFLSLMHALDNLVLRLGNDLGACEEEYPSFVPVDLLKRINYFRDFPHHIFVASPLREERLLLEQFADRHDFPKSDFDTIGVDGILQEVRLVAAPSVCYTCYYALRNQELLSNRIITAKNRCSRNEPKGYRALSRLSNFTMREIIVLGDREFVLDQRQRILDAVRGLMVNLGMVGKIESASDPFFTDDAAYKAVFQHSFRLKYESLAYLPFADEYLAICSVNLHNDSFGKAFGVTLSGGRVMQSACVGFGLERWAYALLCQFGWDRGQWPEFLRRQVSELGSWRGPAPQNRL